MIFSEHMDALPGVFQAHGASKEMVELLKSICIPTDTLWSENLEGYLKHGDIKWADYEAANQFVIYLCAFISNEDEAVIEAKAIRDKLLDRADCSEEKPT